LLAGVLRPSRIGKSKRATALAVLMGLVVIVGVRAALGWAAVDEAEELRHTMGVATVEAAKMQAPLGSGVGSF
ncbi:MAG: hypothetical protein RR792_05250, partial [Thermomonas sp.]